MELTAYHAKYFAYELTKKSSSDNLQKLASTLVDAQVDIKPHQVDAALFAFHSPLSKGAILADEVGLGKTIEAGLVIAQKWAERKRKILIIVPANLRKQWYQELSDKFFLLSLILESKSFSEIINSGNLNPFSQNEIIITSYQFARSKENYLKHIEWDLVVIDEAHRLRNVYKSTNKIAKTLREVLKPFDKLLLTATPLQNSLMELYGLVSIVDEYVFGDLKSFRQQYNRDTNLIDEESFNSLKERIKPIIKRTLRRQVLQYVPYTNRIPMVEEFYPSEEEQKLYDLVTDYLHQEDLYALPSSQRRLMTLILRRLLASSTFAISGTLDGLANKLDAMRRGSALDNTEEIIADEFETYDELKDEWQDEDEDPNENSKSGRIDSEKLIAESKSLREFASLAKSIQENSKGAKLLMALERGFNEMERLGAPKKALIFTESTRTQAYIKKILEESGYQGKVVLFNGSNSDSDSKIIYNSYLIKHINSDKISGSKSSDTRAALVECFKEERSIMVATEAAAEGVNLQFCSLVINYDMPWNPQRIEQRIGRCHRYGQKYDVVVINFLNLANAADVRVYQLLDSKFHLFNIVFGSSDDVIGKKDNALGGIENGIGFEKRIADIYQNCRKKDEIEQAFNALQQELEESIKDNMEHTKQRLLENFDEEVHERLRINQADSNSYLTRYESWLWHITQYYLNENARFSTEAYSFTLHRDPFNENIHPGPYRIGKNIDDANIYRISHPLAQRIITKCKSAILPQVEVLFDFSNHKAKISSLEPFVGQSGYLTCSLLSITTFDEEEYVQLAGVTEHGSLISKDICERLFSLNAVVTENFIILPDSLLEIMNQYLNDERSNIVTNVAERNSKHYESEIDKLDRWSEDKRSSLKLELKELDLSIKELKKQIRMAPNLPEKLKLEKERRTLETNRDNAWREYDHAAKKIEKEKDDLIDKVEKRLNQNEKKEVLFTIKWQLI